MTLAVPLTILLMVYMLGDGVLLWMGPRFADIDLSFLGLVSFIGVIAAPVQILEMFLDKYVPVLYQALGVFLPLITVNCAILGGEVFMGERDANFSEVGVHRAGAGPP